MANLKSAIELVPITSVKLNEDNPRTISKEKFEDLKTSIKEFPEMLNLRPIVVDENMVVLGGNMRLQACLELKIKEVPIISAANLTPEQREEFLIKDNVSFGQWDWDKLANEWDATQLNSWSLDVWVPDEEPDYEGLEEDENIESDLEEKEDGVRKALLIEFDLEHYTEAFEIVKFFRERGDDVGLMLLEHLKSVKEGL